MIRAYGFGYQETLDLPIDTFWMLVRNIDRLNAEDDVREIGVLVAVNGGKAKEMLEGLNERIGKPLVREEVIDRDAIKRLKNRLTKDS